MGWRVAKTLLKLRQQIDDGFPDRSHASDGTIGDAAHASRSSDHNPWVKDGDMGVVTGMDITNDPAHGLSSEVLAEALRTSADPRLKYVISNKKIASFDHEHFKWRPYHGTNPHNHHCHISVKPDKKYYDDVSPWSLIVVDVVEPHAVKHKRLLKIEMKGEDVMQLQEALKIPVTGVFDINTQIAVKDFQRKHGLMIDGIIGPYTWEKLEA